MKTISRFCQNHTEHAITIAGLVAGLTVLAVTCNPIFATVAFFGSQWAIDRYVTAK